MIGPARHSWLQAMRLVFGLLALAAASRLEAAVRVALLQTTPEQSGNVVAALEAKLSAGGKVALVERQEIEKLQHEQQLSAVLGAEALQGRVALGKLLQADLLVFVESQQEPQPHLNVTISETHQGLRLVRGAVPLSDSVQAVPDLEKLVLAAADKQSQTIREIFVVPPFVCNDLGFNYVYLKGAFARVMESSLMRRPGVLVVELDEARALAKEIMRTSGADVTRPLPLYVLGEYRTDGPDGKRNVKFSVRLMRGDKQIAGGTKDGLPIDQAPIFLRQVVDYFLSKSAGGGVAAPTDPKVEAAQLAERAHLLLSVGSWPEAADLAEASLLLDPNQPAVQRDALGALQGLIGPDPWGRGGNLPPGQQPRGNSSNEIVRRAVEHLEPYFREAHIDHDRDERLVHTFLVRLQSGGLVPPAEVLARLSPEMRAHFPDDVQLHERDVLRQAAQELMIRVLEDKARRKVVDETALFLSEFEGLGGMSEQQMRATDLNVLEEFAYLPKEGAVFKSLDFLLRIDPADSEFNRRVGPLKNDDLHREVELWKTNRARLRGFEEKNRQEVAARKAAEKKAPDQPAPPAPEYHKPEPNFTAGDEAKLVKLELASDGTAGHDAWLPVEGWMPAGKGIDLLWGENGIYVMKQPGVIRYVDNRVPKSSVQYQAAQPAFDGQYVWFTRYSTAIQKYVLLAVDPERETAVAVDSSDGLPPSDKLQVAPLGPGQVVVVGSFGQAYAATVKLTPASKTKHAQIDMLHEFRRVPVSGDKEQWRNGDLIFTPTFLRVVGKGAAGGAAHQVAVIWRGSEEPTVANHPIVIDLASGAVRAAETEVVLPMQQTEPLATAAGECWQVGQVRSRQALEELNRFDGSRWSTRPTDLGLGFRTNQMLEYDGALHLLSDENRWVVGRLEGGPFRQLKTSLPPYAAHLTLARSEHYGLVAWLYRQNELPFNSSSLNTTVYRVELSKPVAELLPKP